MKTVLALGAALVTAAALSVSPLYAQGRGGGAERPADLLNRGGGTCASNEGTDEAPRWEIVQEWNCPTTPNPLAPTNTVWIEEMTWMDVRDALAAGKTTVIIAAGGMEPNGPFLVTGKHNYVLTANCEAIARRLGNALCAPILKFVPEGNVDGSNSGHMANPGTFSLTEETYMAVLNNLARNMRAQGFENIIFIGDSGGNGDGMEQVAEELTAQWGGSPVIAYVPEHYEYGAVGSYMREQHGLVAPAEVEWEAREAAEERRLEARYGAGHMCVDELMDDWEDENPESWEDNLHDDPVITLNMYAADPNSISWERRVLAGLPTINGIDLSDPVRNAELAAKIVDFRADYTIEGIKAAIAAGGNVPDEGGGGRGGGGRGGGADTPEPNCTP